MKKSFLALTLGILFAGTSLFAQGRVQRGPMMMERHRMMMQRLKLTEQQKPEVKKVWFDLQQKQIDVRAQIQHARLDYEELSSAENPDQGALSSKIGEISKLRTQLEQNRLDAWFAVNKLLTPDQQKIWKRVLEHPMAFGRAHRGMEMFMRHGPGEGFGMQGPQGMMRQHMPWMQHNGSFQGGMGPMMMQQQTASPDTSN